MHEHDRATEGDHLGFEVAQEVVEPGALNRRDLEQRIRLDNQHHRPELVLPRPFEHVMQPGQVRRVAGRVFLVGGGRAAKVVVAADNVKTGEDHAALDPLHVLGV